MKALFISLFLLFTLLVNGQEVGYSQQSIMEEYKNDPIVKTGYDETTYYYYIIFQETVDEHSALIGYYFNKDRIAVYERLVPKDEITLNSYIASYNTVASNISNTEWYFKVSLGIMDIKLIQDGNTQYFYITLK